MRSLKRWRGFGFGALLAATVAAGSSTAVGAQEPVRGDCTLNGSVDVLDLKALARILVEAVPTPFPGSDAFYACDADASGTLGVPDVVLIVRMIFGAPANHATVDVEYSTLLGGPAYEEGREPVPLPGGRLLFGARTYSSGLPVSAGAFQRHYGGGEGDTYLAVLSGDGSRLDAATYLGGSGEERPPYGMQLAANGDVVVTSGTTSSNFPVSPGAYRAFRAAPSDGYVCRFSIDLASRRWCTFVGAWPRGGLALTRFDEPVVVGTTSRESGFTATALTVQTEISGADDAFVLQLDASGSRRKWATFFGGPNTVVGDVATSVNVWGSEVLVSGVSFASIPTTSDAPFRSHSGGGDAWVARLSGDGRYLNFASHFGGGGGDEAKHRNHVMPDGAIVLGGQTQSPNFRGASGRFGGGSDGWVGVMHGSRLDFLRFLGGRGDDWVIDRASDGHGRIFVVGQTSSPDFPVTAGAVSRQLRGSSDGFFAVLDRTGSIIYATYLGGSGSELIRGVDVGPDGAIYVVGSTTSFDFPTTPRAFQRSLAGDQDAFVMKLRFRPS